MLFYEKTNNYTIWENGKTFILTQGKREIMQGTLEEIKAYISVHPYGTPRNENKAQ